MTETLRQLSDEIAACRICIDEPGRRPLPHEPRPVLRIARSARVAICGQAPGTRVHASGTPFTDPSGDRLRAWMGVDEATFYDQARVAIVPMGFCFPGLDAKGGDLPPRRECPAAWRRRVFRQLSNLRLVLLVGGYAIKWHLAEQARANVTDTVRDWREFADVPLVPGSERRIRAFPMPHPSWRNNAWIRKHAWFEEDLLPALRDALAVELELS